jgi:hypothetical protein
MARIAAQVRLTGQRSRDEAAPAMENAAAAPSINSISGMLGMISVSATGRPLLTLT